MSIIRSSKALTANRVALIPTLSPSPNRRFTKSFCCDSAIIEFGGNDCNYNWNEVCEFRDRKHQPATPLPQFVETLQELIDTARSNGIRPILTTLPPLDPERYIKTISRGLDEQYIRNWLGDIHYLYRWHEMYSLE